MNATQTLQPNPRLTFSDVLALIGAAAVIAGFGIYTASGIRSVILILLGGVIAAAGLIGGIMRPAWKPNTRLIQLIGGLIALINPVMTFSLVRNAPEIIVTRTMGLAFWLTVIGAGLLILQIVFAPRQPKAPKRARRLTAPVTFTPGQNMAVALDALLANKFRSFLTMLGIIIGVMAVVALLSIGKGAEDMITDRISSAGTNTVTISPVTGVETLTLDDRDTISDRIDGLSYVVPQYSGAVNVTFEGELLGTRAIATYADYLPALQLTMDSGRFIDEQDERSSARVAVLGISAADELFGGVNPVGRTVRVNGSRYEVIGVMAERDGGISAADPNLNLYVPLSTGYDNLFDARSATGGSPLLTSISIIVTDADQIDSVSEQVTSLLRDRHGLDADEDADFRVSDQQQLLDIAGEVTATLTVMLTAIAGVSLVVGGIGIMNISLVSVTERTREIGLRKAVGARRIQIMAQFLIETVVLAFMGGVFGVIAGIGAAALVNASGVFTASVTTDSIALGLGFSVVVGLFFGVYPATRAASLQPIEALRYE